MNLMYKINQEMTMKVMVFGSKRIVQKLTESLKGTGIDLVSLTEMPGVRGLLEQRTFDLVLVDSFIEKTEAVCHHIREFGTIPLALIVNERKSDWGRLEPLGADGYLPEEAGKNELAARLRAMWRRFPGMKMEIR